MAISLYAHACHILVHVQGYTEGGEGGNSPPLGTVPPPPLGSGRFMCTPIILMTSPLLHFNLSNSPPLIQNPGCSPDVRTVLSRLLVSKFLMLPILAIFQMHNYMCVVNNYWLYCNSFVLIKKIVTVFCGTSLASLYLYTCMSASVYYTK